MDKVKSHHLADTEIELIRMAVIDSEGNTQTREFLSLIKADKEGNLSYLIRFLSPSDIRGVSLLTVESSDSGESEQYLYLPALGQPRSITGNQKAGYFMGSDFTFEDLRKEDPTQWVYHRLMDDQVDGKPVYTIMSAPMGVEVLEATNYEHRLLYVDKTDYNILKIEFYEPGRAEPLKTFIGHDFDTVDVDGPTKRPARAVMNHHEKRTTSILSVLKSRLNMPIDSALFSVEALASWDEKRDEKIMSVFDSPQPVELLHTEESPTEG